MTSPTPSPSSDQATVAALMHAAADECMSPEQRDIFDQLGSGDLDCDVYARLFRCILKRTQSEPISDQAAGEPIPMLLFCPKCHSQHIDAPKWERDPHDMEQGLICTWSNPPHKSHLCHACENIWRPADVATTGVVCIQTRGKADTWESTAPTTGSAPETIRFDFINADGNEDSKVISHDEMRERYASMYLSAHSNFAATASPAASVLTDEQMDALAQFIFTDMGSPSDWCGFNYAGARAALLAASMGGEKS